ncbi:MAG: hypothetical protein ACYCSO_09935 [Cuniculiplasma sp.]
MDSYAGTPYEDDKFYGELIEKDNLEAPFLKKYFLRELLKGIHSIESIEDKVDDRFVSLEERVTEIEKKLNFLYKFGINIGFMEVPDYPEEEIASCMSGIEEYLNKHESFNPWNYAEIKDLDLKLVLLCVDELISEGKLEW